MSLIYQLLYLLAILFAGAIVLCIIMFIRESFKDKIENTVGKSFNPAEKSTIICLKCCQELTDQHKFCPYCGTKQALQGEVDIKNNNDKSDIETETKLVVKNNNAEESGEVIEVSAEMKVNSSSIEKTEPDVVLNEKDVNSSIETSELQVKDTFISEDVNVLEDIYQSQSKWLNGDNEKDEDMVSMQEQPKDS